MKTKLTLAQGLRELFHYMGEDFTRDHWLAMTPEERKDWKALIEKSFDVEIIEPKKEDL
jgi:hypothetical protein